jgi:hypothetical protein
VHVFCLLVLWLSWGLSVASSEYCVEYICDGNYCSVNVFASSALAAKRQVKRMESKITIVSVTLVG